MMMMMMMIMIIITGIITAITNPQVGIGIVHCIHTVQRVEEMLPLDQPLPRAVPWGPLERTEGVVDGRELNRLLWGYSHRNQWLLSLAPSAVDKNKQPNR